MRIYSSIWVIAIVFIILALSSQAQAYTILWESGTIGLSPFLAYDLSTGEIAICDATNPIVEFMDQDGNFLTAITLSGNDERVTRVVEANILYTPYAFFFCNAIPAKSEYGNLFVHKVNLNTKVVEASLLVGKRDNDVALYGDYLVITDGGKLLYPGNFGTSLVALNIGNMAMTTIFSFLSEPGQIIIDQTHQTGYILTPDDTTIYKFNMPLNNPQNWIHVGSYNDPNSKRITGICYWSGGNELFASMPMEGDLVEINARNMTEINRSNNGRAISVMFIDVEQNSILAQCIGNIADPGNCGMLKINLPSLSQTFYPGDFYSEGVMATMFPNTVYGLFTTYDQDVSICSVVNHSGEQDHFPFPYGYFWIYPSNINQSLAFLVDVKNRKVMKINIP